MKKRSISSVLTLSGFNPAGSNGFGSGLMCGLLFIFDLPMTIFINIWNFLFGRSIEMRSFGHIAFWSMFTGKQTLGSIIGFVVVAGSGVGTWFNPGVIGAFPAFTYLSVLITIAVVFAVIDLVATIRCAVVRQPA